MHPKKAEMVASWDELSRTQEDLVVSMLSDALRPDQHGLGTSLLAALPVPLVAATAVLAQVMAGAAALIPDAQWNRMYPAGEDPAGTDGAA